MCTGRPQPYAEAILQTLDAFFPNCPSIVENGCFLYDPVEDVLIPNPAILGKENDLENIKLFLRKKLIKNNFAKIEPGKELCISLNPVLGMTIKELYAKTLKILPSKMRGLVFVTHSSSAVDITPKGVNKATGLEFLFRRTGIDFSEMVGVGDTAGDLPMLEKVGFPTCPGNAAKEVMELVKSKGGYIAQAPNTSGVWKIILHLMKNN